MVTLTRIEELSNAPGPLVLAIGVFDGAHLGHRAVLSRALEDAAALGGSAVAITFDPHPARILRPEAAPQLLTPTRHKLSLLASLGFRFALVMPFDRALAGTSARDFVEQLSNAHPALREIVVGQGWAFGKGRCGTVDLVQKIGVTRGFEAVEIPPVLVDGIPVSSTRIRRAVAAGDLEVARACLGRDFSIQGTVIEGQHRGRALGFPTANLRSTESQLPPGGVYAVRVFLPDGQWLPAVANLGLRPTMTSDGVRLLETHIPGFSGDLYGADIEVAFLQFLRGEKKFSSIEALADQITKDVELALASASRFPLGSDGVPISTESPPAGGAVIRPRGNSRGGGY